MLRQPAHHAARNPGTPSRARARGLQAPPQALDLGSVRLALEGSHIDPKNLRILQGMMRTGKERPRALETPFWS